MQNERASKKQQELLQFVDGFIKGNGYGPSYREIMRALGYKSVSTVAIHVDGLIAKGYLARRDKSARSLEVVSLRSAGPTHSGSMPSEAVESELRQRIAVTALNETQRTSLRESLELLGFSKLAKDLESEPADA